jgi:hypothetical protein
MPRKYLQRIDKVEVTITAPCVEGALYPHYDTETDYVTLGSIVPQQWPFGVNIDNLIILDFNAQRILASVEILVPRELWSNDNLLALSQERYEGALILANRWSKTNNIMIPSTFALYTTMNEEKGVVLFGDVSTPTLVRLSAECKAIVEGISLVGFLFDLPKQARRRHRSVR